MSGSKNCILRYSVRPFLALMQQQQQQQQQICKYWMMALSNRENLKVVAAYLFHAQTAVGLKIHFKKQSERRTTQQEHTEAFVCLCTPLRVLFSLAFCCKVEVDQNVQYTYIQPYINTAFYHKLERGLSQQKPFPLSSDFFFFFFKRKKIIKKCP